MGAYIVAQAHKQCEVGTTTQFQSGPVAKTQTSSLPGVGAGPPEARRSAESPTHIYSMCVIIASPT